MAKQFYAPTEDFIKIERGVLDADATAGSNVSLTLISNQGFTNLDYVCIGYEGNELAELEQVNQAVTAGTSIRVATLKFNHKKGEPITIYRYNKRKFYGAVSAGGSYVELTSEGSPKDIQVDDPMGTLIEYAGTTYNYFKSIYYNSQTTEATDINDSDEVAGDESLRYATIYGIKKHAGLAGNPYYSDGRIEDKRKNAENEINSMIMNRYTLPLTEVPPILNQICELLAAGYIDFEEFGKDGEGVKWLGEARALLKSIQKGTQRLIGADSLELATNTKVGVLSGYPDASADGTAEDRIFRITDKF
jgi:phage gp36-like protein